MKNQCRGCNVQQIPLRLSFFLAITFVIVIAVLLSTSLHIPTALASASGGGAPPPTQGATFQVTHIDMSVNPTSIQGTTCGTFLTVTYTATFHVAANSPGGVVQFNYTINNGRGENMASITFGPGETTKTFTFTWAGNLPADHVYPGNGGVISTSPNMVLSPLVGPTGQCS